MINLQPNQRNIIELIIVYLLSNNNFKYIITYIERNLLNYNFTTEYPLLIYYRNYCFLFNLVRTNSHLDCFTEFFYSSLLL